MSTRKNSEYMIAFVGINILKAFFAWLKIRQLLFLEFIAQFKMVRIRKAWLRMIKVPCQNNRCFLPV